MQQSLAVGLLYQTVPDMPHGTDCHPIHILAFFEDDMTIIRPLFFYFLVYGFLGWKNGSVGRKKKKKKKF